MVRDIRERTGAPAEYDEGASDRHHRRLIPFRVVGARTGEPR
jgi:hypothetical protein